MGNERSRHPQEVGTSHCGHALGCSGLWLMNLEVPPNNNHEIQINRQIVHYVTSYLNMGVGIDKH